MMHAVCAALLLLAAQPLAAHGEEPPAAAPLIWASQCAAHNFTAGALPCGTCKLLSRALGAAHASALACRSCCSASLDIGTGAAPGARKQFDTVSLRLCRMQAGGAGVSEWLEKREESWAARGVAVEDVCAYGEPPAVVLRNDGDEAEAGAEAGGAAAAAPAAAAPGAAAGGSRKAAAAAAKRRGRAMPEAAAPPVGVVVPVGAWKVEHIDAFLEAALRKE